MHQVPTAAVEIQQMRLLSRDADLFGGCLLCNRRVRLRVTGSESRERGKLQIPIWIQSHPAHTLRMSNTLSTCLNSKFLFFLIKERNFGKIKKQKYFFYFYFNCFVVSSYPHVYIRTYSYCALLCIIYFDSY